jgi:head-tail adaptor
MNIGFLDRRITIEAPGTNPTIDAYGEAAQADAWQTFVTVWADAWQTFVTVWAAMDNKAARSSIIADQETAINRVTWRVRSSSFTRLVTPKYRVKYGNDYYNILAVQEVGRKEHLISAAVVMVKALDVHALKCKALNKS